ncbi:transcriptional regulator, MarR family [Beutenbergia cavernae DSM 12333]|uniref:Transcriptional regulator, MarR family n=1 Tax=Beutenbergia cavernae (strain ATCC BAA-8 / DSM 12333 / CCUG 43141 / JCM 11478 / NBRC 16432 / NCIMB 13614 / HKI 0122) TaxID=471853 RepID=C5BYL6_BEUC1|nr:MarR family transcriptional regulator [Beutenbergia cavernae]ACQ78974.1 transcriptional regulator, MarR family [Beutenbergia cavernae DSM 12333]
MPDVLDRLLEITYLFQRDMARTFEADGLTPARLHLLWVLGAEGPLPQRALAAALDVSPRNVTGLVDALEASGHAARRPHPSDRRIALVTLTDRGETVVAGMQRDRRILTDELVAGIDPGDLARLERDLAMVADRLRSLFDAGRPT